MIMFNHKSAYQKETERLQKLLVEKFKEFRNNHMIALDTAFKFMNEMDYDNAVIILDTLVETSTNYRNVARELQKEFEKLR